MKVVIDRFEGDFAVVEICENQFANIPKSILPEAKEGDIVTIEIHRNENSKESKERLHRLFNKNK